MAGKPEKELKIMSMFSKNRLTWNKQLIFIAGLLATGDPGQKTAESEYAVHET